MKPDQTSKAGHPTFEIQRSADGDEIWCGDSPVCVLSYYPEGLGSSTHKDWAPFLVRACNSHADLLAALVRVVDAFQTDSQVSPNLPVLISWETNQNAIAQARAAITRATGQA